MQNLKLICRANQTFRLTRDLSAYLASFNLATSVIRLQMRQGPFLPVLYEWSTSNGKAVYSAGSVVFSAPVKDVLNFKGTYYGDIRIEASTGDPHVIAQCTFDWSQGFTRTTADETEADVTVLVDTVEVDGGAALFPTPLWADASQSSFTAPGVFTGTQANLNVRSLINQANPATWFYDTHQVGRYQTEAITGAVDVPATATVHECSGVAGYVRTKKNSAYGSDAAVSGVAIADGDNTSIIGGAFDNWVNAGYTTGVFSQGGVFRTRIESPGVTATGLTIAIGGSAAPANSAAISLLSQNAPTTKWSTGFLSQPAAATIGIELQQVASGASQSSQPIKLTGMNAGSVAKSTTIYADLDGNLRIEPQVSASVAGNLGIGVTSPTGKLEVASGTVATSKPIVFSQTWNDGGASAAFSTFEIRNSNVSSNMAASDIFAVYGGAAGTTKIFNIAGDGGVSSTIAIYSPQIIGGRAANSTLTLLSASAAGTTDKIVLGTNLTARWNVLNGGEFQPASPNAYDIGDATNTVRRLFLAEYQQFYEMTAPAAPPANGVRIYAEDNGAGKTRLMALFATGAAQQIAIQP